MYKIFVMSETIVNNKITVDDDKAHHLKDVLRLRVNDELLVGDEKGNEYLSDIEAVSPQFILRVKKKMPADVSQESVRLTVACALPKKSAIDDIIDKLTQLGVDRIIPMATDRVVVSYDDEKKQLRLARWRSVALSSAEQSQRKKLPVIEPVTEMMSVLADPADYDLKLIFTLPGKRSSLKKVLQQIRCHNILALIGPEGDFTEEEVKAAKEAGFLPVSLGDTVLRVETAAVAAAGFIMLYEKD